MTSYFLKNKKEHQFLLGGTEKNLLRRSYIYSKKLFYQAF